jgi:hypothetical protein
MCDMSRPKKNLIKKARPNDKSTYWDYPIPKNGTWVFNLNDLKKDFARFSRMKRDIFLKNLPDIAHFACIISYYNDLTNLQTVSDVGIVHQIIHLMTIDTDDFVFESIYTDVRKNFKILLKPS